MKELKQFLKGDIHYINPSIIKNLKKYNTIQVDSIVYDTKEIIDKIQRQGCSHCKAYKAELESLRYQLKQLNAPKIAPIEVLLEKFIDENYVKIKERVYSRKQLFTEVNAHLRGFGLQIVENTDPVWRYVIEIIIGDTNRNYRKLKLKKR